MLFEENLAPDAHGSVRGQTCPFHRDSFVGTLRISDYGVVSLIRKNDRSPSRGTLAIAPDTDWTSVQLESVKVPFF
jgi:hypothetical protein